MYVTNTIRIRNHISTRPVSMNTYCWVCSYPQNCPHSLHLVLCKLIWIPLEYYNITASNIFIQAPWSEHYFCRGIFRGRWHTIPGNVQVTTPPIRCCSYSFHQGTTRICNSRLQCRCSCVLHSFALFFVCTLQLRHQFYLPVGNDDTLCLMWLSNLFVVVPVLPNPPAQSHECVHTDTRPSISVVWPHAHTHLWYTHTHSYHICINLVSKWVFGPEPEKPLLVNVRTNHGTTQTHRGWRHATHATTRVL